MKLFLTFLANCINRYRFYILILWLVSLIVGGIFLKSDHRQMLKTELRGAEGTEAAQVLEILGNEFGFQPGNTMALVFEQGKMPATLKTDLLKSFSPIATIQEIRGHSPHSHALYLIKFQVDYPFNDAQDLAIKMRHFMDNWQKKNGINTYLTGNVAFYTDIVTASKQDSAMAEIIALVCAMVVLIVTFGSLVAAVLPILMGITTLLFLSLILRALNLEITPISQILNSLVGLALAIDYALFIVSRFREELAAGKHMLTAITQTLVHAGETIAFSALIMACSIVVLLIPNVSASRTIAINLLLVILVSLFNALLILPSLLLLLKKHLSVKQHRKKESPISWERFAQHVTTYPIRYFLLSTILLLTLAAPVITMQLWEPVQTLAPVNSESMQGYRLLEKDGWGGELLPVNVIVRAGQGGVYNPAFISYIYNLTQTIQSYSTVATVDSLTSWQPDFKKADYQNFFQTLFTFKLWPQTPQTLPLINSDNNMTLLNVYQKNLMAVRETHAIIEFLREYGQKHPEFKLQVGGMVARTHDFTVELYRYVPQMVAIILGSIFILLFMAMRSIVIPLKAGIMNFLPILSAFGLLTLIFQHGFLTDLLPLPHNGAVMNLVPCTLFCIVFGLSMDYEILILSRITEAWHNTGDVKASVVEGLTRSSSVITGAALILLCVFIPGIFSRSPIVKEIGIGITSAILLDATIVRLMMVPSLMLLMGEWNWWNPFQRKNK